MAATNPVSELKKQLGEKKVSGLYLFFGEEVYLIDFYIKKIKELVPDMGFPDFNFLQFDGKTASLREIGDAIDGFPMMTDKRLIIINDSGAFASKASAEAKDFYLTVPDILQEDTVLVFRETEVDKRGSVYKAVSKKGKAVEFAHLSDGDLITWVIREASSHRKKITRDNAELLVGISDRSIETLKNEIEQLSAYAEEEISAAIIDKLASRSMEARAFDLCDFIAAGDSDRAIRLFYEIKTNEQSAYPVIYLLYSSFEKSLKAQLLNSSGEPAPSMMQAIGASMFALKKYLNTAKHFSRKNLMYILKLIPELDLSIKRGEIEQWQAAEKLIFECLMRRN